MSDATPGEPPPLTPPAIGEHVDELERLGYVERVPDPSDRRAKLIRPTERGTPFMQAAYYALAEIENERASAVGAKALARLRDALAQLQSLQQRSEPQQAGAQSEPATPENARSNDLGSLHQSWDIA